MSLQPGQRERQNIGLISSEGSLESDVEQSDNTINGRFQKDTTAAPNMGNSDIKKPLMSHDLLKDMFGEDAITESINSNGLALDKTQIEIISETEVSSTR